MTSPTDLPRRPPNRAGLLLLFVVLGGVFGMHALDSHGVAGNHMVGMARGSSMPASAMDRGSPVGSADQAPSSPETAALPTPSSFLAPADDFSAVMSLCLGVLAATVLLLVRRAHGPPTIGLARVWLTVARQSTARGRDRDPPSLTLLSVRRV